MPRVGDQFPGIAALMKGGVVHDDNRFFGQLGQQIGFNPCG